MSTIEHDQDLMIDFEAPSAPAAVVKTEVAVKSTVAVTARPADRAYLAAPDAQWDWKQLRDYVVNEIETRTGPFPRNTDSEIGIFQGFIKRWGDQAAPIARAAFEVHAGVWRGAPISVTRFCRGSDPYFAEVIAANLTEESTPGW